jgi:hypothetical protein
VRDYSVLWRRLDLPGHEAARLSSRDSGWQIAGAAVFAHGQLPCRLDYLVVCDLGWRTISGRVTGWVGDQSIAVDITVDSSGQWQLNGTACPQVAGCTDLDLNFSPCTNMLPIRRLGLVIGAQAEVRAAWLRFPGFTLEPLDQIYRRLDAMTYRYESAGGKFVAELKVNEAGFATEYPDLWRMEAEA